MDEYIKRSDLLAEYDRVHVGTPGGARKLIEDAPTIDAVPVVRCKDCWSAIEVEGFMGGVLYCKFWGHDIDEECFCSYGERKVGE